MILLMLAMLKLGLSVLRVHLLRCLPLPLLSSAKSLTLAVLFNVCFLLAMVGSCILWYFYGYQGADSEAELLALTQQLFDAALCCKGSAKLDCW